MVSTGSYNQQMQKHSVSNFIDKTFTILQSDLHTSSIAWNEDGTSFAVTDQKTFEHEVLPIYFKHSNLTSFQRQLNMYNFHKKKNEQGNMQYHHRLFRRHQRQLLKAIRRKPSEDQIQIGEELLRKLAQEHEETGHQPLRAEDNPGSIQNGNNQPPVQAPSRQAPKEEPSYPYLSPNFCPAPFYFCYPQPQLQPPLYYPYVEYTPAHIIDTHVLIQRPSPSMQ